MGANVKSQNWEHQAYEYQVGRDKRSRMLIWPMRSGKSKACIDKANYQFERGNIEGVVVIAPNGVHLNWCVNEIPRWHWTENGPPAAFAWETPKRGMVEQDMAFQRMCASKGMKYFCVNMEALKHLDCRRAMKEFLAACHNKFFLVVSEAHHFGRPGSRRTYFARSLAYHAAFVQTETGTPILTGPMRAFSQFELLAPGALGCKNFDGFKNHYADWEKVQRGGRTYDKIVKYKNLDELTKKISGWSSVVLREDLGDMPPLIRTERPVVMTPACRTAYLEMVSHHLAEIGDEFVAAKDAGPRMVKLQQIMHGWVKDPLTDKILDIDPQAAIWDAVLDEIEGTRNFGGKALVWCRYKEDIRRLMKRTPRSWGPLEYHGDMTARAREANRMIFLNDVTKTVLYGTPDTGGEGLDFSAADAVIFASIPPNGRMIKQAEERATVKGGKSVSVVRVRHYGTVDDRLWDIVDTNAELADTITGHGLRDMLMNTDC